MFEI
jgi:hypothetical protein